MDNAAENSTDSSQEELVTKLKTQKRKSHVSISSTETSAILKGYLKHPAAWNEIVSYVTRKSDSFPKLAKDLYNSSDNDKALKTRCQNVFSKLMIGKTTPPSEEIKELIKKIKEDSKETSKKRKPQEMKMLHAKKQKVKECEADRRESIELSDTDSDSVLPDETDGDNNEPGPSLRTTRTKKDKRKTSSIMRENAIYYNSIIRNQIPSLLQKIEKALAESDDTD